MKKSKKILIGIAGVIAILLVAMFAYLEVYYHSVDVESYMISDSEVTVVETDTGWLFDGTDTDTDIAMIFYPGAKVEAESYAPLMHDIAKAGVDCFLIDMPFRMAFFGMNKCYDVMDEYSYEHWILSGHSLGGAMAASVVAKDEGTFDGLVLMAAYPTSDISFEGLRVLSVYGSNDLVVNMASIEEGRGYMPSEYTELCIEGGNHAQFGSYGNQDGDGEADISAMEQRAAVVEAITGLYLNFY